MTAERRTKPKKVMRDTGLLKHNNQQVGLEQVPQLSPGVLAEIVDCAVLNVKERKVFGEKMSSAITHTNSYKKTAMNSLLSKQSMKDIEEIWQILCNGCCKVNPILQWNF